MLEGWAEQEQRSVSSLVAYILTNAAKDFQRRNGEATRLDAADTVPVGDADD